MTKKIEHHHVSLWATNYDGAKKQLEHYRQYLGHEYRKLQKDVVDQSGHAPWRDWGDDDDLRAFRCEVKRKLADDCQARDGPVREFQMTNRIRSSDRRGMLLHLDGVRHAPENELGVVFLFSRKARRLGFVEIDVIQPRFPDCWAMRSEGRTSRRVWVEFEFRSHSFRSHVEAVKTLHPRRGYVVCWEHDWPGCEKYAHVIELRTLLGVGRQVWIQNSWPEWHEELDHAPRRHRVGWKWAVAPSARPGIWS